MKTERAETREDIEQAAAAWIAQRDAGAWTEADEIAFREWLAKSAGHRAAYYRLDAAWTEAGRVRVLGGVVPTSALSHDQQATAEQPSATLSRFPSIDTPRSPRKLPRILVVAASLIALLAAAVAMFRHNTVGTESFTTVVGGLQVVPVSDGSRVTLNTDTKLRISLTDRERIVDLERGEAFFEVAHDPTRTFVVKAGRRRIIAVGTQFSVRREMADVRVVVYEGTVRYEDQGTFAEQILLPAGTVARAQSGAVLVHKEQTEEAGRLLAWRNGYLAFRNTPLAEAVAEFNRYSTRRLVIEDPAIATLEVGGVFHLTSLDSFVRLLVQAFPVRATAKADKVILTSSSTLEPPSDDCQPVFPSTEAARAHLNYRNCDAQSSQ